MLLKGNKKEQEKNPRVSEVISPQGETWVRAVIAGGVGTILSVLALSLWDLQHSLHRDRALHLPFTWLQSGVRTELPKPLGVCQGLNGSLQASVGFGSNPREREGSFFAEKWMQNHCGTSAHSQWGTVQDRYCTGWNRGTTYCFWFSSWSQDLYRGCAMVPRTVCVIPFAYWSVKISFLGLLSSFRKGWGFGHPHLV